MTYTAEVDVKSNRWAMDCVCSQHSTPNRSAFVEYRSLDSQHNDIRPIKGIEGSRVPIGVGKVRISTVTDAKQKDLILTDVLHVPGLPLSLVSQGQLTRANVRMKLVRNGIQVGKRGITAWLQDNNLFYFRLWEPRSSLISFKEPKPISMPVPKHVDIKFAMLHKTLGHEGRSNPIDDMIPAPADSDSVSNSNSNSSPRKINNETLNLWHARMGHLGHQNVRKLATLSKGIDLTKKIVDKKPCDPCAIKKARNAPHKSHIRPEEGPLELIHSDICGPITPRGHDGGKYFVTFIND